MAVFANQQHAAHSQIRTADGQRFLNRLTQAHAVLGRESASLVLCGDLVDVQADQLEIRSWRLAVEMVAFEQAANDEIGV